MSISFKDDDLLPEPTGLWEEETDEITSANELEEFIQKNIKKQYRSFKEYFDDYVAENDLELPVIMRRSNIDKGYFYNIVNGDRKPQRDKILCICIGAGMDIEHINRALRISGFSKLDPKNERDLRIKFAIKNGIDNVIDLNIKLDEADLNILK